MIKERNVVKKNPLGKFRAALVYPSEYKAGMSNLGVQIIYDLLNAQEDIYCERFFLGYDRSLETGSRLKDFHLIMFSWQFELDAQNILKILSDSNIPLRREDRKQFIIVGGPCAVNPEPLSRFVDAFYIGEAEVSLLKFIEIFRELENPKEEIEALSEVDGIYLPALENKVKRVYLKKLDESYPVTQVISEASAYGEAFLVEVSRGCSRGCRFCMGGYIFRPRRERSLQSLRNILEEGLRINQPRRVVLLGASVTDYSRLDELSRLISEARVEVSVPSLRADSLTEEFLEALARTGQRSLTIAPESCQSLRFSMNKAIPDEQIFKAARYAAKAGLKNLKMYFIFGFPGEREDHIIEAAKLVSKIKAETGLRIKISVNPLVPKPHSAMQWAPFVDKKSYSQKLKLFKKELKGKAEVKSESHRLSILQTIIARGDERLGDVLERVYEEQSLNSWKRAFKNLGMSFEDYLGERDTAEPFAWDKIDTLVRKDFLIKEYNKYFQDEVSGECCIGCGVCYD